MLSEAQVARIEERLLEERRHAMRTLRDARRDIGHADAQDHGLAGAPAELAEQGSEAHQEILNIQTAERHSELLELIDVALLRLREHPEEYDVSAISGKTIPFERLELVPWTRVLAQEMGLRVPVHAVNGNGKGNGRRNGNGSARRHGYRKRRASTP